MRFLSVGTAVLTGILSGCGLGDVAEQVRLERIATIYDQGDTEDAIQEFTAFLSEYEDNDLAWTILGHAYEETDADLDAQEAYTRALALNPKRVEALTGMGVLKRKASDYEGAMEFYGKAVTIEPGYAQAYSSMVTISLKRYEDEEALTLAQKAYALDDEDPTIASNLAIAYHYNGMAEERDAMARVAKKLGYQNLEALKAIFDGSMTIRD